MSNSFLALIWKSLPLFFQGMAVTVQLFLLASILSIILGICFGVFTSEAFKIPIFSQLINAITFTCRAIPFFVQLLIMYFVVPELFGFNLNPFPAAVIALGICSSGYVGQFIRGGINEIDPSHWESAFTLGYSKQQTLFKVIFPQVLRSSLPALNNELESLLKSTAIASSIGMLELTRIGMNIVSREMELVPVYLAVAVFYGCLSVLLKFMTKQVEKRFFYATN